MVKSTFGFQNEQELINLYNSASSKTGFFESKLLINLMKRLSFGKKYFLEKLIAKHEKDKTLQYYIKKHYMSNEFYKKGDVTNRKVSKFVDALDFINKELKKNNNIQQSDFAVAFLNTFNTLFPEALKEQDPMRRQNRLV